MEEEENGNYLIISQVRPWTNQHLCKNTVTSEPIRIQPYHPPIICLTFHLDFFFCLHFYILQIFCSGEPPRQRSVHLSAERLQTHGAPSHPHCQRSAKLASVSRRYVCPSVSILSQERALVLRTDSHPHIREFLNVSQFPSLHSPNQTAFKLSSSHLSLNTVS